MKEMHDVEQQDDWVEFNYSPSYRRPRTGIPHISISRRGKIQLNSHLMEAIGFAPAVRLLYNSERRSIGILPRPSLEAGSLAINLRSDRRYGEVYARSFLQRYGIKHTTAIATNVIETASNGMLIVDLRHMYDLASRTDTSFKRTTPSAAPTTSSPEAGATPPS